MIKTKRMNIRILSDDEMREMIKNENDEEMKKAYGEMLQGCLDHPEQRQWYAVWMMEDFLGTYIGDLCFKGLDENGSVEIGYGISPEYWGNGYATEAVRAVVEWAEKQEGVNHIEAETAPDNKASQRVLEKCGFFPTGKTGEEGPRYIR